MYMNSSVQTQKWNFWLRGTSKKRCFRSFCRAQEARTLSATIPLLGPRFLLFKLMESKCCLVLFGSLFLLKKIYRWEGQLKILDTRTYPEGLYNKSQTFNFFFLETVTFTLGYLSQKKKKITWVHSCLILAESAQLLLGYKNQSMENVFITESLSL